MVMRLGLRGKLIAGSVGLVVGFLALGCGVLSALISHYADRQLAVELTAARRSFESHSVIRREAMRRRAEFLADSAVLKALLSTHDRRTIEDGLPRIARCGERDLLQLLGTDGRLLASLGAAPSADALDGNDAADRLVVVEGRCFAAVQVPVREGELALATLLLGDAVDDTMAREIVEATSHDAMLLHDGQLRGSASQAVPDRPLLSSSETAALTHPGTAATDAAGTVVTMTVAGHERRALRMPLHPGGGTLLLSRDPEQIVSLRRSAWALLLSVAAVVGLIGVLVCLRTAQRLSKPLQELTRATDRLAAGDHAVRVAEAGHDEVARLGRAFNAMAATIGRLLADVWEQVERAEAANRAKDGFLSTASHELRTPATNIRAAGEILREYGDLATTAERASFVDIILAETERLESLVGKVLDFSEIEAGTKKWARQSVQLVELADVVRDTRRAAAARKRVEIEVEATQDGEVFGDREALSRLLGHLVENAIHFSPEGGVVSMAIAHAAEHVELRVRDHGPGVPDEAKERVFERFYQHGDLLTEKPPGLGLGLTLARAIAEAHGGSCHCEDAPGGGALFVVVVAAAAPTLVTSPAT